MHLTKKKITSGTLWVGWEIQTVISIVEDISHFNTVG